MYKKDFVFTCKVSSRLKYKKGSPTHDVQLVIPKPSWEFFLVKGVFSTLGCLAFHPGQLNASSIPSNICLQNAPRQAGNTPQLWIVLSSLKYPQFSPERFSFFQRIPRTALNTTNYHHGPDRAGIQGSEVFSGLALKLAGLCCLLGLPSPPKCASEPVRAVLAQEPSIDRANCRHGSLHPHPTATNLSSASDPRVLGTGMQGSSSEMGQRVSCRMMESGSRRLRRQMWGRKFSQGLPEKESRPCN